MPRGSIKRSIYLLKYRDLNPEKKKWITYKKFKKLEDIAKVINVSYQTAFNISQNNAKKYNEFYKIIKL